MDRQTQSIALEKQHVHDVYQRIAPHFNDTHYKAWPRVKEFLLGLEPGSIVADVGCGNGKYLGINKHIYKVGSDCCSTLVNIAHCDNHEAMVCDNICLPYRDNSFDAVISIAVIHHFATTERRAQALNELARICRPGGQIMIYVWAMEQKLRKFDAQDVLVPWHLQPKNLKNKEQSTFLPHHFINSGAPSKECTRRKQSQKSKIPKYTASSYKAMSHPNHARVPFIPSKHSTEVMSRNAKPATNNFKELFRTNSDQGYDPLSYAEKNHFKRLLLPTRSDSVDEVFLNISTEGDHISCREVNINEIKNNKLQQSVHTNAGEKRKGLQRMFSFDEMLPKEAQEEPSLIESLTSTATQVLHAISRQRSLEIEPSNKVEGNGADMSSCTKSLVLKESDKSVLYKHTENCILSMYYDNNGVKNGYSQGNTRSRSNNCAIDTFTNSNANCCIPVISNSAQPNQYQADAHNKPDDIQQIQPSSYGIKTYGSKALFQLKPLQSTQPIIGINSLTAQGELYNQSCPTHSMPHSHVSARREQDSSIGSVSSSDDNLTVIPVAMTDSDETLFPCISGQNKNTTQQNISNPLPLKCIGQATPFCSGSKHEVSKANEKVHCQDSSEEQISHSLSAKNDFFTLDDTIISTTDVYKEAEESGSVSANCKIMIETKPQNTIEYNSEHLVPKPVSTISPAQSGSQATENPSPSKSTCLNISPPTTRNNEDPSLYLRYYHVFREGELIDLIEEHVDSLHILRSYYDHANWCVIAEKVQVWTI